MTWIINVKPTDHLLGWFVWSAQRKDGGEGYLFSDTPLRTQQAAYDEAKAEVTLYMQHQQVIAEHSIINEEFTPVLDGEE
jgi:hypothetical protein